MSLPKQIIHHRPSYSEITSHRVHQNNQNHYKGGLAATITTQGNQGIRTAATTTLNAEVLASNKRGGSRRNGSRRKRRRTRRRKYL